MIRTKRQFQEASRQLAGMVARTQEQRVVLKQQGLTESQIQRALNPIVSMYLGLKEDIACYQGLLQGKIRSIDRLAEIGKVLIELRILRKVTQSQLARRLEVDQSQVSRDEKQEYRGAAVERVVAVAAVLGVDLHVTIELKPFVTKEKSPRKKRCPST